MKDIVISFTRWTCPDVALGIPVSKHAKHNRQEMMNVVCRSVTKTWRPFQSLPFYRQWADYADIPQFLDIFQVSNEDLMVYCSPENARSKEVNTVKV